jgi:YHS domain-containing protein
METMMLKNALIDRSTVQRLLMAVGLVLALIVATTFAVRAQSKIGKSTAPVFTGLVQGVAVGGFDPVAYFTEGKPVPGLADVTLEHQGATWRFASADNREKFKTDPSKHAPQFGGYCAWAVAEGYTAKGDPSAWTIADGKLYLNYNKSVQKTWEENIPGNVRRGASNWSRISSGG